VIELNNIIQKMEDDFSINKNASIKHINSDNLRLPFGLPLIDEMVDGGIPRGELTQIFGPHSSGKTILAIQLIKETQKNDGLCAYIDTKDKLDLGYLNKAGIDMDSLLIVNTNVLEDISEALLKMIKLKIDLIVLDSTPLILENDLDSFDDKDSDNNFDTSNKFRQLLNLILSNVNKKQTTMLIITDMMQSMKGKGKYL